LLAVLAEQAMARDQAKVVASRLAFASVLDPLYKMATAETMGRTANLITGYKEERVVISRGKERGIVQRGSEIKKGGAGTCFSMQQSERSGSSRSFRNDQHD
jgi:hypothetical protein